jgi:hypothetical protein
MPPPGRKTFMNKLYVERRSEILEALGLTAQMEKLLAADSTMTLTDAASTLTVPPALASIYWESRWDLAEAREAVARELWYDWRFKRAGSRVLTIHENLASQLSNMDPHAALSRWALPPFDAFYLHFPGGSLHHRDDDGQQHRIGGVQCAVTPDEFGCS